MPCLPRKRAKNRPHSQIDNGAQTCSLFYNEYLVIETGIDLIITVQPYVLQIGDTDATDLQTINY